MVNELKFSPIWVDFNDVYEETLVETTLLNTPRAVMWPDPGDVVPLKDDDGATCLAVVRTRVNDYITCELLLASWQDPAPSTTFEFEFRSNATPAATADPMPTYRAA